MPRAGETVRTSYDERMARDGLSSPRRRLVIRFSPTRAISRGLQSKEEFHMKKIILAVAVAAAAVLALAATASADVARYQTQTMTLTALQPEGAVGQWQNVWTHVYTAELNPCDGSFSGVGSLSGTINGPYTTETITGHVVGNTVTFTATRPLDGVVYSVATAPLDNLTVTMATSIPVVPWELEVKVSATMTATSDYRNHGDYVKQSA